MARFQSTIYVRLPQELKQRVSEEAHRRMLKDSDIVREAIAEHVAATAANHTAAAVIEGEPHGI